MKISIPFFSILVFIGHLAMALNISGSVNGFKGQFIRLYIVEDFISYKEVKSDVAKIADDGSFNLSAIYKGDLLSVLRIEDMSVSLVCPAGSELKVKLSFDEELNRGRIFDKELTVEILNGSDKGVNNLIWQYQKDYADFLEKNQRLLVAKQGMPAVKMFQNEMTEKYGNENSTYFADYLEYNLLILEDAVLGSEVRLFESGIKNRKIIYGNLAYMSFFMQFYQQRFVQISQGKEGFELLAAVNGTQDYAKLLKIALDHKFIDSDTLAELFVINGLREVYNDKTFKKTKVLQMLKVIEERALNRNNQKIAGAVYDELSYLNPGSHAPEFSLFDREKKLYHLSDFSKAPLLICFWSATSNASLRQLSFLTDYHEKYGDQLRVLGICIDDNTGKAEKHLASVQPKWLNLFKDRQYDVTDKYRIHSVPTFVLINAMGDIVKYPASGPEGGLEAEINRLISEQ